jgi:hypothetical protein
MNDTVDHGSPVIPALLRHFADLRDGVHGDGAVTRLEKETVFGESAGLLAPFARQVLEEFNEALLLGTGVLESSGLVRHDGGLAVAWTLSWPEQRAADISPITLEAHYGAGFHHPHLHGATVGEWPLNVFDAQQAAAELPTLRAIAAADLHNLVFQRDYRIVPAITRASRS